MVGIFFTFPFVVLIFVLGAAMARYSAKEVPISRLLVPSGLSLGAGILVSLALGVFSRLASSQAQGLITPSGTAVLALETLGLCVIAGALGWKYAGGGRRWSLAGAIAASVTFGANAALLPTLNDQTRGLSDLDAAGAGLWISFYGLPLALLLLPLVSFAAAESAVRIRRSHSTSVAPPVRKESKAASDLAEQPVDEPDDGRTHGTGSV